MIAFITGSGFYDHPGYIKKTVHTPYGDTEVFVKKNIIILERHGEKHKKLPNHINYKANLYALKELSVKSIVAFTVVGAIDKNIPLGIPIIVNELYFPDNRLPNNEICSFFDTPGEKSRGHLIADTLFHSQLSQNIQNCFKDKKHQRKGIYAHVNGPRFNTKTEIKALQQLNIQIISQTCGPEAVLSNEMEIPFAMVAFPIDYANGVKEKPTPIETLNSNLTKSSDVFRHIMTELPKKDMNYTFENFIYRFE